jgi:alpha-galactosidase
MNPRIALIGAGSVTFTRNLLGDILSYPELQNATIALHDIDGERLELARRMAQATAAALGASPTIEASINLPEILKGCSFVINTIQVGGYDATRVDFDIPARYGIKLTIGDTIGVGGIFRGLRTIPVILEIARQMELYCPDALLLNYTNPMSMTFMAVARATSVPVVGLCHSVYWTGRQLAGYLGLPPDEVDVWSGGINHIAFLLRLEHQGRDLYPQLRAVVERGGIPEDDLVRAELFRRLGYYPTESSEHHAEYSPYFLPHEANIARFNIPVNEYLRRSEQGLRELEEIRRRLDRGETGEIQRSGEYAAEIIYAMTTGRPARIAGNVMNKGLVANLPADACVEVPCLVDRMGVQPTSVGTLPRQLVAMMRAAIDQQALTVDAILLEDPAPIYHAMMLDPLAQARLDLDGIWQLTDEMLAASRRWLPAWATRGVTRVPSS